MWPWKRYHRMMQLQQFLDQFGYPKDPLNDPAFNELGILLHGKKEWARRRQEMSKNLLCYKHSKTEGGT